MMEFLGWWSAIMNCVTFAAIVCLHIRLNRLEE